MTPLDAALTYAKAGWYVLPTAPTDVKNPGSVVGRGWHTKSTRDPEQIRAWWKGYPNRGIALHSGRSGAVVFDLDIDDLDELSEKYRTALASGLVQHTRTIGDRGHYVFTVKPGEEFGNGAGAFRVWGEVRGKNGVIIASPTVHPTTGGRYHWDGGGEVPSLPDVLRQCLSSAGDEAEPLTREQLATFYSEYASTDRPKALDGVLTMYTNAVSAGGSRHEALVNALPMAFREAVAGFYPAQLAADRLCEAFVQSFEGEVVGRRSPAPNEFARIAEWAAAQALLADPEETVARANRDDPAEAVIDDEAFWTARDSLSRLRQFARARRVGPWSMLGAVLARVQAVVPPSVVFPPTVGSHASLNLFVALVAKSGEGKGASESAAADAVITTPDVYVATPGSGEGIPKQYAHKSGGKQVNLRNSVMFSVPEIDTLTALGSRSSATLLPELRKAWMGERLGFGYADPTKAVPIMDHRYRMTMVVGVQPGRSRALLDDADGGTPQRFVWLPTTDETAPDVAPEEPAPLELSAWPRGVLVTTASTTQTDVDATEDGARVSFAIESLALEQNPDKSALQVLDIPDKAAELIHGTQLAKLRGEAEAGLDGHAILARLKVAGALMVLDGRTVAVDAADWDLAGVVMAISDRTRARMQRTVTAQARELNVSRGRDEGLRAVAAEDAKAGERMQRVMTLIREHLKAHGEMSRKSGKGRLRADLRSHYDDAVDRLVAAGVVEKKEGAQGSYRVALGD
ncbi:bifunctional DNA primase/polymerase [Rhodococcus sp. NPDC127528]|uniref:bifunctional DNA primase/polymerase n=1 Tax=unclassified Rhodococcus (in: high G+C Gram-positive bacteria) TaxID=192944 RepID=UPI0036297419